MGLGDGSVQIVCEILMQKQFSKLDLSKNLIKDEGVKYLA